MVEKATILVAGDMGGAELSAKILEALGDKEGVILSILEEPSHSGLNLSFAALDADACLDGIGTPEGRRRVIDQLSASDPMLRSLLVERDVRTVEICRPVYDDVQADFPVPDVGFLKKAEVADPADKRPGHLKGEGSRITKMRRR